MVTFRLLHLLLNANCQCILTLFFFFLLMKQVYYKGLLLICNNDYFFTNIAEAGYHVFPE